eukprot:8676488-Alexandrium_andersonii.AAC.1
MFVAARRLGLVPRPVEGARARAQHLLVRTWVCASHRVCRHEPPLNSLLGPRGSPESSAELRSAPRSSLESPSAPTM